jgi:hypothetical protein
MPFIDLPRTALSRASAGAVALSACIGFFKRSRQEPMTPGRRRASMEKRYYNAASLERSFLAFERRFQLDSETFLRAHAADDEAIIGAIPLFLRHSWASFYGEWKAMATRPSDPLSEGVERELATA